jgi:shikimate dehydrogenase
MVPQARLLVNATPVGMHPNVAQLPVSEAIIGGIQPQTIVYDLIYTPRPTLFLEKAQRRGAIVIDGLEMLVQQGAKALETWLSQPVPVDIMREAIREQSAQRK